MKTRLRDRFSVAIIVVLFTTLFIHTGFAGRLSSNATRPSPQTASEVKLPDTAAGKTFTAFLKAFNTGNLETMKKFHSDYAGNPQNAEKDLDFYQQSGGIKVVSIGKSSDYALEVIVETKNDSQHLNFALEVDKNAPYAIVSIHIHPA